jgi:SHS2 domain-containing protein
MEKIEFLDHPADIQMHCTASSFTELCRLAVKGMIEYAVEPPATAVEGGECRIEGASAKTKLLKLLNYFIELLYGENKVVVECTVSVSGDALYCRYKTTSAAECRTLCEVKAVTLCGLRVFEEGGIHHLYCIFDV